MRYIIMFSITILLAVIIIFYNPFLGVYKNNVTIEYDYSEEGYYWEYDLDGESLKINSIEDNKYTFEINKNGISEITFIYTNGEDIKYDIYYKFRVFGKKIYWLEGVGKRLVNYPNPY